jgi:hypothetical protein
LQNEFTLLLNCPLLELPIVMKEDCS